MKRVGLRRTSSLASTGTLTRSQPLKRTSLLRKRPAKTIEPGAYEYKKVELGRCQVCGAPGLVRRHHIVYEQHVRRAGGDPYSLANSMWIGIEGHTCQCHPRHHSGMARIPLDLIPDTAMAFAVDLLGEDRAADYLCRRYAAPRSVA